MSEKSIISNKYLIVSGFLVCAGLYLVSLYSFVLFHTLIELSAIAVAFGIFMLLWNSRRYFENHYLQLIGIAYLFVGLIDLFHTLAYNGMNVFQGYDADLPTQLWIAGRYLQSVSLLIAPFFFKRKLNYVPALFIYSAVLGLLLISIFSGIFPACYIEGVGLTPFKKISEYVISAILLGSIAFLVNKRNYLDKNVFRLFVWAIGFTIISEIFFTFYVSVYGISNLVGHGLKLFAFYLIYRAIVVTGLMRPYDLLFRDLKRSEETIKRVHAELETRVAERTSELTGLNEELESEKRQIKIINKLLKLFVENTSRKEFLDNAVKIIQEWCNCRCLGIRILDEKGNIPYESSAGFSQEFLNSESMISVQKDQCACIRAMTGNTEPQDLPSMTEYGSFYFSNTFEFMRGLNDIEKSRFRGVCVKSGFESLAIIPIRYHEKVLGLIHIADEKENMFPINDVKFIETLSHIIGEAIYKFNAEEELRRSQEQLRSLTAHLQAVKEDERTTIAREIHDELGQIMTALKIDLSWLRNNYGDHEALNVKTESMMSLIDETIQTVRRIITELRPGILDHLGLSAAMEWQFEEFKKLTCIQCNVVITPEEIILSKDLSINMFRIFQEILTNIMRHSEATSVNVLLKQKDGAIILKVEDNGKGITEEEILKPASFGIMGMRERVNYMGGSLKIGGIPQEGTTIEVIVPIDKKQDDI